MKFLIVLAALIVCVCSESGVNWSSCGQRSPADDDDKIVGGNRAQKGDWPWQISLQYYGSHICGGTLITNQHILTAAHCVDGATNPSIYTIGLGLTSLSSSNSWSKKVSVSRVTMHPSYNSRTISNDIAIIKLSSPVSFNKNLAPACVPATSSAAGVNQGSTTWATGWGTLYSGGSISNNLMEVSLPALSAAQCKSKYYMVDTNAQICAGVTGGNADTCQGDSGGPLVAQSSNGKWNVVGVTSFGYGCADGGVYTYTPYYYNWIQSQLY